MFFNFKNSTDFNINSIHTFSRLSKYAQCIYLDTKQSKKFQMLFKNKEKWIALFKL